MSRRLKPDFFEYKRDDPDLPLEFCILKITNKFARSGKDIKKIFRQWDTNNTGHLDFNEIQHGLSKDLGIFLTTEECHLLTNYLDKNGNGLIEEDEFTQKINYDGYQKRSHCYLISEQSFIDVYTVVYLEFIGQQKKQLEEKILQFDDNGDKLL